MTNKLAGLVLIAVSAGYLHAQEFEAASIKASKAAGGRGSMNSDAGRITYTNTSLRDCLMAAYDAKDYQISGPDWLRTERFDIVATAGGNTSADAMKPMLQKLLTSRFQMTVHRETKELPVYALVVGKNGTKLKETENPGKSNVRMTAGGIAFTSITLPELVDAMSSMHMAEMDRPVVDHTGLTGRYDFTVTLFGTQEEMMAALNKGDFGTSVFTLIQEQLGLKLEPMKLALNMVVVDKAEKAPTGN